MYISNSVLIDVLREATDQELISLSSIIEEREVKKPLAISNLRKEISTIGGHTLVNICRGDGTGYLDILDDIAKELKIKDIPSYDTEVKYFDDVNLLRYPKDESKELGIKYAEEVEEKIIVKILEMAYKDMSDEDKKTFDDQINKVAQEFNSNATQNLSGIAGLMALGNLGGFATYTFLTTSLSTLSIGTLGFATYTGATSLLSVMLGPIGWAGLGAIAILTFGQANTQKSIPIVATIGAIRQRIKYERQLKSEQ